MEWYWYVVMIVGVILVYFLVALVFFLLQKHAQKKVAKEFEKVIPYEKERLELILDVRDSLESDGRHLPKAMTDAIAADQESMNKVPADIASAKGQTDFLILYMRKYIKEKGFLKMEKYQELDKKLEGHLWMDPSEKNSPYKKYNDAAFRYNSYLGMMILAILNSSGKNKAAPIF